MTRLPSLALAIAALITTAPAAYAKQAWACQYTGNVGLYWKNDEWEAKPYELGPPFVLEQGDDGMLTRESAAIAIDGKATRANKMICNKSSIPSLSRYFCTDLSGSSLVFDLTTGRGAVTSLGGAVSLHQPFGVVWVTTFICQK